ncbi:hypothetical protein M9H77_30880 [Catharanthus roseus]|uniref:Uncharacterized protein n=1 Tax=Catharanthus roseus TaxID=4058 RepID=A0ACC0A2S6_CATRO|nr:hypothetical protein M9H77_30880 [Catharanthus roseus]
MIAVGLAPTPRSYTILINGNCKINRIDEAMSLFKEMLQRSLSPDVVTYNTILQGFFRMGMTKEKSRVYFVLRISKKGKENGKLKSNQVLIEILSLPQNRSSCFALVIRISLFPSFVQKMVIRFSVLIIRFLKRSTSFYNRTSDSVCCGKNRTSDFLPASSNFLYLFCRLDCFIFCSSAAFVIVSRSCLVQNKIAPAICTTDKYPESWTGEILAEKLGDAHSCLTLHLKDNVSREIYETDNAYEIWTKLEKLYL